MANDQSVVGRRRIYYNRHGDEDIAEMEGEKHKYSEGENRILRLQIPLPMHFLLNNIDGRILKFIVTMTKVSVTRLFLKAKAQRCLKSLLTGCSLLTRNVLDCKGETLDALLRVRLYWMKNIGQQRGSEQKPTGNLYPI